MDISNDLSYISRRTSTNSRIGRVITNSYNKYTHKSLIKSKSMVEPDTAKPGLLLIDLLEEIEAYSCKLENIFSSKNELSGRYIKAFATFQMGFEAQFRGFRAEILKRLNSCEDQQLSKDIADFFNIVNDCYSDAVDLVEGVVISFNDRPGDVKSLEHLQVTLKGLVAVDINQDILLEQIPDDDTLLALKQSYVSKLESIDASIAESEELVDNLFAELKLTYNAFLKRFESQNSVKKTINLESFEKSLRYRDFNKLFTQYTGFVNVIDEISQFNYSTDFTHEKSNICRVSNDRSTFSADVQTLDDAISSFYGIFDQMIKCLITEQNKRFESSLLELLLNSINQLERRNYRENTYLSHFKDEVNKELGLENFHEIIQLYPNSQSLSHIQKHSITKVNRLAALMAASESRSSEQLANSLKELMDLYSRLISIIIEKFEVVQIIAQLDNTDACELGIIFDNSQLMQEYSDLMVENTAVSDQFTKLRQREAQVKSRLATTQKIYNLLSDEVYFDQNNLSENTCPDLSQISSMNPVFEMLKQGVDVYTCQAQEKVANNKPDIQRLRLDLENLQFIISKRNQKEFAITYRERAIKLEKVMTSTCNVIKIDDVIIGLRDIKKITFDKLLSAYYLEFEATGSRRKIVIRPACNNDSKALAYFYSRWVR